MTEKEMWEHVKEDLLYIRKRVDHNADKQDKQLGLVQQQISELRIEVAAGSASQKVKITGMITGILVVISAFVSTLSAWVFSRFSQ